MSDDRSSQPKFFTQISQGIETLASIPDAVELLTKTAKHRANMSRKQRSHLLLKTIIAAAERETSPTAVSEIGFIVEIVLPLCIESSVETKAENETGDGQTTIALYRLRDAVSDWIRDFPIDHRTALVQRSHEYLASELSREPRLIVLQVITAIGHRTKEIVSALKRTIDADIEISQNAIGTLIGLGVAPDDRDFFINRACLNLNADRLTHSEFVTVRELCGPDDIDLAVLLLEKSGSLQADSHDKMIALASVASAIDRCDDDPDLHRDIWHRMKRHQATINMDAQFAFGCNTPDTVADYLHWLAERDSKTDDDIHVDIIKNRIDSLFKPEQLRGFAAKHAPAVKETLVRFATLDTLIDGGYVTPSLRAKRDAWELLQCIDDEPVDALLVEAIVNESNPSAANTVAGVASTAMIESFPIEISDGIRQSRSPSQDAEDREFFRQLAFVQLARTSGNRGAFEAMLNFQYLHDGEVLVSFVDAIVGLAVERQRQGDTDIVELLLSKVSRGNPYHQRAASLAAFCQLMMDDRVSTEQSLVAWELLEDDTLDELAKQELLEAIACSDTPMSDQQVNRIRSIARQENSGKSWRAWELLQRRRCCEDQDELDLFNRLGLVTSEGRPTFDQPARLDSWQAYSYGLLLRSDHVRFTHATAQLVREARADCVHQVIPPILECASIVSDDVLDALAQRVATSNNRGRADTELTAVLGIVSPRRLINLAESDSRNGWMIAGRYALCTALASVPEMVDSLRERKAELMLDFMRDASVLVRRTAYRSLSRFDPLRFLAAIETWSIATNPELTMRAAEAIRWIPKDVNSDFDIDQLGLSWHSDPKVRELAKDASIERRNRLWGESYLEAVLSSAKKGFLDPEAYCYSRALTSLGDDETICRLSNALSDLELSPRLRRWLEKTRDDVEKAWKQRVAKWSDPWTFAQGTLECVDGKVRSPSGQESAARIWLWRQQRRSQSERYSWGGTIEEVEDPSGEYFMFTRESVELLIDGRPPSAVNIFGTSRSSSRSTRLTFFGNSPYPDPTFVD